MVRINKDLRFDLNKPVKVYYNLHKHCLSVLAKAEKGYRLWCHTNEHSLFGLSDVKFKVSEAGRNRVLKEKRKNVHAFVIGYLHQNLTHYEGFVGDVYYNPYKSNKFHVNNLPIEKTDSIIISGDELHLVNQFV